MGNGNTIFNGRQYIFKNVPINKNGLNKQKKAAGAFFCSVDDFVLRQAFFFGQSNLPKRQPHEHTENNHGIKRCKPEWKMFSKTLGNH